MQLSVASYIRNTYMYIVNASYIVKVNKYPMAFRNFSTSGATLENPNVECYVLRRHCKTSE